jgi:drug/metabolite transporter (DMT)-like permease
MSNEMHSLKKSNHSETDDSTEKVYSSSSISNTKEKKKYINLYICHLSIGIIFTYIFIMCSITINIVNRVIFWKYKFKFNFTLVLLQQMFCMVFYSICSQKSEIFIEQTGGVSFSDFWKLKFQYIGYCLFFILKTVTSFLGYQLVTNIPMYVNLRKFLTAMTFIYQYFCKKKKISNINICVVILVTLGALLTGIDDYSTDIKGYLAVFMKNMFNLVNLEISENFKKKNGMTNLKLLVYNSFLSTPLLFIYIFINGEFFRLISYFNEEHNFSYLYLIFFLFISCSIVMVTNASFFISNEKNTSLFTQLVSDTKYIVITFISYVVLQSFTFTWKNITGLFLSTLAAIIITINSLYNNIKFKKEPQKEVYKNMQDNNIDINSDSNSKDMTKFEEVNISEGY